MVFPDFEVVFRIFGAVFAKIEVFGTEFFRIELLRAEFLGTVFLGA